MDQRCWRLYYSRNAGTEKVAKIVEKYETVKMQPQPKKSIDWPYATSDKKRYYMHDNCHCTLQPAIKKLLKSIIYMQCTLFAAAEPPPISHIFQKKKKGHQQVNLLPGLEVKKHTLKIKQQC